MRGNCSVSRVRSIATRGAKGRSSTGIPGSGSLPNPVADWIQAKAKDRMTEVLRAPQAQDRCGVRTTMTRWPIGGRTWRPKELGREKEDG